jgi:fatty-acyl-CoA synthase
MSALVTDPIRWWGIDAPNRPAITFDGTDTVDYRTLDRWTDAVAHHFTSLGVRPGDRVGIVGPNTLEWCAGALGALKAGAILACYNHRFVAAELGYLIEDSEPKLVLAGPEHTKLTEQLAASLGAFEVVPMAQIATLRDEHAPAFPRVEVDADQAVVIVYTSGTTAKPKGVVFTHRTTFSFVFEWSVLEPALTQEARMIFVLSLAGAPGILWALLHMTIHGAHLFLEKGFEPTTTLQRLVDERIDIMMGVPVLFEQIARLPEFEAADLSSIRVATVGGARVSLPALEAWLAKGVVVRQIYGMTELGGTSTANPRDLALERPECVGRGSMFAHHRVVRPDGTDCDPGEPGEIIVRSPSVTPGYWRNDEATAAVLRDGWFHTGDMGSIDNDGLLRFIDRMKDMIITGGYNVAPAEIEDVVNEIDGVTEVAVIAVHDDKFGETPAAIIHTSVPVHADDVVKHCSAKLAAYKVPRYVIVQDEPLPRMPSGKIAKRTLREQYEDIPSRYERVR